MMLIFYFAAVRLTQEEEEEEEVEIKASNGPLQSLCAALPVACSLLNVAPCAHVCTWCSTA